MKPTPTQIEAARNAIANKDITFAHCDSKWQLSVAEAALSAALSVPAAAVVGEPVAGICPSCGGDKGRYEFDPQGCACSPRAWPIDTDDQVEALARECDWDNRKYMTPKDYAIWCERMRKFARLAALGGASHE